MSSIIEPIKFIILIYEYKDSLKLGRKNMNSRSKRYEEKNCDKFIEYALLNGIFGKQDNSLVAQITKHEDDSIDGLRKIFFPGVKILEHKYTYLKKFPLLLPVAWIHRLINGVFKWKYSIRQMSGDMIGAAEYSKERLKWLEELGLTDELKNK